MLETRQMRKRQVKREREGAKCMELMTRRGHVFSKLHNMVSGP